MMQQMIACNVSQPSGPSSSLALEKTSICKNRNHLVMVDYPMYPRYFPSFSMHP